MRVLFLLKKNSYGHSSYGHKSSGLLNSIKFIVDMLRHSGVHAHFEIVTDNNDIDREVTRFRPDVCVIEALWVVPEKFDVLQKLHPRVKFVVRLHSDFPFLANEGIAMEWVRGYIARGVEVALNSRSTYHNFRKLFHSGIFLPNFYPLKKFHREPIFDDFIRVGCFGAIRPLKNQLLQAVAAIEFAKRLGRPLAFFVNATRTEQGGASALKNLRGLFDDTENVLVETKWHNHHEFLTLMSRMHVAMAVSFTETFCITAADAVQAGTPLVCSDQVPWASSASIVPATDTRAIVDRMEWVTHYPWIANYLNKRGLRRYSHESREQWLRVLDELVFA